MSTEKIAIFVDVQNIYYTCRQAHQKQFNYKALWQRLAKQGEIILANAYAIEHQDDSQHKFQRALKHIGFNVKLKPYIQRADGSAKGDWDVGIAIDIIETARQDIDKIVLLSGDGDFGLLLRHIKEKYNMNNEVYGVRALTSHALISATTKYHAIDNKLLF